MREDARGGCYPPNSRVTWVGVWGLGTLENSAPCWEHGVNNKQTNV